MLGDEILDSGASVLHRYCMVGIYTTISDCGLLQVDDPSSLECHLITLILSVALSHLSTPDDTPMAMLGQVLVLFFGLSRKYPLSNKLERSRDSYLPLPRSTPPQPLNFPISTIYPHQYIHDTLQMEKRAHSTNPPP